MTRSRYQGAGSLQGVDTADLTGRLIVLEGAAGAGGATQVALLREWLEARGLAVTQPSPARSSLAGLGLQQAMEGHALGDIALNLLYAADLADRLEREIIPALRAGFVCLTERYVCSIIARALVRGSDHQWLKDLFGFAPAPDVVFYLEADVEHLVPRVLTGEDLEYWEFGMDARRGGDIFEEYCAYQERLLAAYRQIADEHRLVRVDANRSVHEVFNDLRKQLLPTLRGMQPQAL